MTHMNIFHNKRILVVALALVSVVWQACTPDPLKDLTVDDSQVFITNYDQTANFASYKTFSMSDSVAVLTNNRASYSAVPQELVFTSQVASNLIKRGFARTARANKPDLGVNVARVSNTQVGISSNYNPLWDPLAWGGSGGWGGTWGYGGSSFYNPYGYSFYQVTENYWYIEVFDLKNAAQNGNKLRVLWSAQIRGSGIFDTASMNRMIEAVFSQSSYLKTN